MKSLAIIADDLSSATDCGIQVTRSGLQTTVLLGDISSISDAKEIEVISVDLDSRGVPGEEAYLRAKKAALMVTSLGYRTIYKSIDSTLRGNLGAEVEGTMDSIDVDFAVIAPAFPFYGRTTVDGWHYLNEVLINQTEFASDPQAPVREANLIELFSIQSKRKAGLVTLETLRSGPGAVNAQLNQFKRQGIELVVFDAQAENDLDAIVQSVAASRYQVLWVGSTGMARCVPQVLPHREETPSLIESSIAPGRAFLVAGSASEITHHQLAQYQRQTGIVSVELNPVNILSRGENEAQEKDRCITHLNQAICQGKDVVLSVRSSRRDIQRAKELGREIGLTAVQVSATISEALADLTATVVNENPIKGLILTGGDTAKAVCKALKGTGIQILGEVEPGIPLGRLLGPKDLLVVTKAGAFGTPLALVNSLSAIQKG